MRPQLKTIAFSDDIFGPPRPWLEEFCARYKREIGLPWAIWAFPRMVDEQKIRLMRDAGLWAATLGIQSGSDRIRRDSYERETSNEEIVNACKTFARHGVVRNLDFIGDNPYETIEDRLETLDLLGRLPKPFYFNFFSLTYFPGVDLTERALRDGYITTADVEDVAEKGYHLWGGALLPSRTAEELRWDVAYAMAVHGMPTGLIRRLHRARRATIAGCRSLAQLTRQGRELARLKTRTLDRIVGRPNLFWMFWANTAGTTPSRPVRTSSPTSTTRRSACRSPRRRTDRRRRRRARPRASAAAAAVRRPLGRRRVAGRAGRQSAAAVRAPAPSGRVLSCANSVPP